MTIRLDVNSLMYTTHVIQGCTFISIDSSLVNQDGQKLHSGCRPFIIWSIICWVTSCFKLVDESGLDETGVDETGIMTPPSTLTY